MNRTEKSLWNKVRSLFPGTSNRVENGVAPGFPDTYHDWVRKSYWVELKIGSTRVAEDPERAIKLMRWTQRVWSRRHVREGARVFLLVGHSKGLVMYQLLHYQLSIRLEKIFQINGLLNSVNKLYFNIEMRKALEHG